MRTIYNENMVDYMIDGLPVYKRIETYKNTRQVMNYKNHIKMVEKYKQAKKDFDEAKENFDLMKYISWQNKYDKTSLLYKSGKYPNWYYYKDQEFIEAIELLNFKLHKIMMDLYGLKNINIYESDGSIFDKRSYCTPENLDWIFNDCWGTYVIVNDKKISSIRVPIIGSENFDKDYQLYIAMLNQKNVNYE